MSTLENANGAGLRSISGQHHESGMRDGGETGLLCRMQEIVNSYWFES